MHCTTGYLDYLSLKLQTTKKEKEQAMSNLQTLIDAVETDGVLFNHRPLAEKVAEEIQQDYAEERDDDASAKIKALISLGYNQDGHPICERCRAKEADHHCEIEGMHVALCNDCYPK
jgi:hypothetical protein